ncbi:MAG: serine/threonine protein kinase, partial [Bradymonadaceae bacterium]
MGAKCPNDEHYYVYDSALPGGAKDPVLGTLVADKYVILGLIGEGGMGAVYRALQLPVEREVAFKVLRTELQDSDKVRDRFIQEARAVSRLSHPNIITLHDFGFENDVHPYMVMEYAPGVSLTKWLRRDDLTLERIVHVGRQILSALTDAHIEGIVHRDLKPENMIVSSKGSDDDFIKVLDFGIARLINKEATQGLTREGEVFGTPHYMAPEQAQGHKDIGPPADVYSLGIMLYEMLCGEPPFEAPAPLSVLFMHINEPLPTMKPRPGITIPHELHEIVKRATAKDARDRYQNASEMLAAMNSAFSSGSSTFAAITGQQPALRVSSPADDAEGIDPITSPPTRPAPNGPLSARLATSADVHTDVEGYPRKSGPNPIVLGAVFIALIAVAAAIFFSWPTEHDALIETPPEPIATEEPR